MAKILKVKEKKSFDRFINDILSDILTEDDIHKANNWIKKHNEYLDAFNQLIDSLDKLEIPEETKVAIIVEVINKKLGLNMSPKNLR